MCVASNYILNISYGINKQINKISIYSFIIIDYLCVLAFIVSSFISLQIVAGRNEATTRRVFFNKFRTQTYPVIFRGLVVTRGKLRRV